MTDATRKQLHDLLDSTIEGDDGSLTTTFHYQHYRTIEKTLLSVDMGDESASFTCLDAALPSATANLVGTLSNRRAVVTVRGDAS